MARASNDFREGSLMFTAPGQVIGSGPDVNVDEGWALFHSSGSASWDQPGQKDAPVFLFPYEVNEALHIQRKSVRSIKDCVEKIDREYMQSIDKHTQSLMSVI